MGVAAYNRGSNLIREIINRDKQDVVFQMMDDINSMPKIGKHGGDIPFDSVVICKDPNCDVWWILDPVKKFDGFGYWYTSLRKLVQSWNISLTGYDFATNEWTAVPKRRNRND